MGRSKRNSVFEHARYVRIHIILQIRIVSSGHLLSIETNSIHLFCLRTSTALNDCADAQAELGLPSAFARRHVLTRWGSYDIFYRYTDAMKKFLNNCYYNAASAIP